MVTQRRDLRSGEPVWSTRRKPPVPHERLERHLETDVLVLGAGISGALVAETLTEAGLRVVVVDRRSPLAGSTSASTALLQYELDVPLIHLSRALGVPNAERIWRRSKLALEALRDRARRFDIDADLVRRDSLQLAGDVLDAAALAREETARRRAGFEVELLSASRLKDRVGIRRRAALVGFGNLVAEPRKLAGGFLRVAHARGARILSPVDIVDVDETKRQVLATTSAGFEIRAKYLVYATGYELPDEVRANGHRIASTWAIATKPQRAKLWPTECMIWEASERYLYLRTTPDGRIVCGGEDEAFEDEAKRDALLPKKVMTLQRKLRALLPHVDVEAEFQWTGNFGESERGTPSIGLVPRRKRTFAVLGYGGNGITFSMLAAQILRGLVTGTGDPDAELFSLEA